MARALGEAGEKQKEETYEDRINRLIESRKLLPNASYYASHGHAEKQDAGDLRRPGSAERRDGPPSSIPHLQHEAGDPRGIHPGCAQALHAGSGATTSSPRR